MLLKLTEKNAVDLDLWTGFIYKDQIHLATNYSFGGRSNQWLESIDTGAAARTDHVNRAAKLAQHFATRKLVRGGDNETRTGQTRQDCGREHRFFWGIWTWFEALR